MSGVITCRYCPFYAPSVQTPIWGYCAGVSPPERVKALNEACPFRGDEKEIRKQEVIRGFYGHDLRRLQYYAVSEFGFRSRLYYYLDDLLDYIESSGLHYSVFVCFIDSNGHVFSRAEIVPDPKRLKAS